MSNTRRKRPSRKKTYRFTEMRSNFFIPEALDHHNQNVGPISGKYRWLTEKEEMAKRAEHQLFLTVVPTDREMEKILAEMA